MRIEVRKAHDEYIGTHWAVTMTAPKAFEYTEIAVTESRAITRARELWKATGETATIKIHRAVSDWIKQWIRASFDSLNTKVWR